MNATWYSVRQWWSAGLLAVVCCLALVSAAQAQQDDAVPRFEPAECMVPTPEGVTTDCGWLYVPENRAREDSARIRLAVAILRSHSATPEPDPVIFLTTGGPGGTSVGIVEYVGESLYLEHRDFIFLEQRGAQFAEPSLACPEFDTVVFNTFTTALSNEVESVEQVQAARACRDRLVSEGVDLSAYTSVESAADIEALRQVLGIEQYNLTGTSYAARLALTVMRLYPDGLRSVVLDSVYNPASVAFEGRVATFGNSLAHLFSECAANPECSTAYPNLEEHFYTLVERMNVEPIPVTVSHPQTGEPVLLNLTGTDLLQGVFNSLYGRDVIRFLPFIIESVYAGDLDVVEPVAQNGFSSIFGLNNGMYYAIECNEEYPFNDRERAVELSQQFPGLENYAPVLLDFDVCAAWGGGTPDAVENEPVESDVPTLVLAGAYDPITPVADTAAAAETLSSSYYFLFPAAGHGIMDQSECAREMAAAFFDDPTQAPDSSCMASVEPIDFVTPGQDIFPTGAIYALNRDVIEGGDPLHIGLLAVCLILFVAQLVVLLVTLFRRRGLLLAGIAGLVALVNLVFVALLVNTLLNADYLTLGFGLPGDMSWILWLPVVGAVITVALVVVWFMRWRAGRWGGAAYYALYTVAAIAFVVWLASRGLVGA